MLPDVAGSRADRFEFASDRLPLDSGHHRLVAQASSCSELLVYRMRVLSHPDNMLDIGRRQLGREDGGHTRVW
jgi:hypothetical protein